LAKNFVNDLGCLLCQEITVGWRDANEWMRANADDLSVKECYGFENDALSTLPVLDERAN